MDDSLRGPGAIESAPQPTTLAAARASAKDVRRESLRVIPTLSETRDVSKRDVDPDFARDSIDEMSKTSSSAQTARRRIAIFVSVISISSITLVACSPTEDETPATSCVPRSSDQTIVSYAPTVKSIMDARCVSCHGGGSPQSGLSLESFAGARSAVVPGSPQSSKMYQRVSANGASRMQPSGGLSSEEISSIENWIASCAP